MKILSYGSFTFFQDLLREAKRRNLQIVAWTVNTPNRIRTLRRSAGELEYLLTDLPFRKIAEIQCRDFSSFI